MVVETIRRGAASKGAVSVGFAARRGLDVRPGTGREGPPNKLTAAEVETRQNVVKAAVSRSWLRRGVPLGIEDTQHVTLLVEGTSGGGLESLRGHRIQELFVA